jgi:DNA-binding NarL/FixJ family response regulator
VGRYDEAEAVLLAAAEAAKTQGRRPLVWPIAVALGNVYRAQKRRDEAERMDAVARSAINECAATIAGQHVRDQFLERAMARIPEAAAATPRQAAKKAFDGLTDREREVAILVMQGHSNRQIAQMLVLSERTVTTHIGNILSKLNLNSRTQIARWALEKGLAPS